MEQPITYRLSRTTQVMFGVGVLLMLTVGTSLGIKTVKGEGGIPAYFVIPRIVVVIGSLHYAAYKAEVSITLESGVVTFKSLLRSTRIPATAIRSVEISSLDIARQNPYFRHSGGHIRSSGRLMTSLTW